METFWQDTDGNYSEYGNSTSAHFSGEDNRCKMDEASFQTISRMVFRRESAHSRSCFSMQAVNLLLVTQIAFSCCHLRYPVYYRNWYTNEVKADTSNERDGIFGDGYGLELAGYPEVWKNGYTLNHTIVVNLIKPSR